MNTRSYKPCPVCGSQELRVFFGISSVPVHCNLLWQSREAARNCPTGDIKLAFCPICGLITNLAFDPTLVEYRQDYENSLFYSPRFQEYALSQASRLVERYNLHNGEIVEIGCGQGDFLLLLCELGKNRGVGFDPTSVERSLSNVRGRIKFIRDQYSDRYGDYRADLIVCRHVLEHIPDPRSFLFMIRQTIGSRLDTPLFFEVPNSRHIFQNLFVWDIIYEHCSYFTPSSLSFIFSSSDFQVCRLTEEYNGQFLCIDALPGNQDMPSIDNRIASDLASFAVHCQRKVETCRNRLEEIMDKKQVVVIWGAGSKGVTFLNTLKDIQIDYAVDINPRKQGMYIPGTGQRIVPPEFLQDYQPDVIIMMNPIYKNEIHMITEKLGLTTNFMYV